MAVGGRGAGSSHGNCTGGAFTSMFLYVSTSNQSNFCFKIICWCCKIFRSLKVSIKTIFDLCVLELTNVYNDFTSTVSQISHLRL